MSKLGGHLVGYGIETNGKVEYHWLDKPKHNMIVKSGLEHLLQFGGDPLATYEPYPEATTMNVNDTLAEFKKCNLWVGKIDEPRVHHGALCYCAYGSGDKDTEFTDTDLENRLEMTEEIYQGYALNGQKFFPDTTSIDGIKYRISHHFSKVTDKTIIKELGWFGKAGENTETAQYVLFARIKLDEELVLQPDQSLIVTYELTETFTSTTIANNMISSSVPNLTRMFNVFYSNRSDNEWSQVINVNSIGIDGKPSGVIYDKPISQYDNQPINTITQPFVYNFPTWFINVPNVMTFGCLSTPSNINWYKQLNRGWIDSLNYSSYLKNSDLINFKWRALKYKENSFERILTVPLDTTLTLPSKYYSLLMLENGIAYFIGAWIPIYWMKGAKKISYTTDVME